jgi:hypothetical protein
MVVTDDGAQTVSPDKPGQFISTSPFTPNAMAATHTKTRMGQAGNFMCLASHPERSGSNFFRRDLTDFEG